MERGTQSQALETAAQRPSQGEGDARDAHGVRGLASALSGSIRFGQRPSPLPHKHVKGEGEEAEGRADSAEEHQCHSYRGDNDSNNGPSVCGDREQEEHVERDGSSDNSNSHADKTEKRPLHGAVGALGDINIARELKINQRLAEKNMSQRKPTSELKLQHDRIRHSVKRPEQQSELSARLAERSQKYEQGTSEAAKQAEQPSELSSVFNKFKLKHQDTE
eukprot:m.106213 g.106213  ORF g.106213 m.106213 type:complete len:220 (-) comp15142_c0_seq1:472-1131(-)